MSLRAVSFQGSAKGDERGLEEGEGFQERIALDVGLNRADSPKFREGSHTCQKPWVPTPPFTPGS